MRINVVISGLLVILESLRLFSLPCPSKSELRRQEGWGFSARELVRLYVEINETVQGGGQRF